MTFIVKLRGSAPRTAIADYECPVHGRFERVVERDELGDPPMSIACDNELLDDYFCGDPPALCGKPAEYRISAPLATVRRVEAVKGGWTKPARSTYTDTRNLGEGQSLEDWKADRARVWEEKRKADVVRFAREHNESTVRGSG